ncbi:MAG: helix-turn-helix domain-containing protein [Spirochaetes bacterium]|nr:helix-turn-helix domain-containing protein [Spirochaetota bacterium]
MPVVRAYLALFLAAAVLLPISAETRKKNITSIVDFIEDTSGKLSFPEIAALPAERWHRIGLDATRFAFSKSAFWFRFDFHDLPDFGALKKIYTVFEWKPLDSVELFYRDTAGNTQKQIAGDAYPKSQWSLPEAHFPAVEIVPEKIAGGIFYIRLTSTSLMNFPIFIKSEVAYLRDLKREVTLIFAYSTIIVILIAFALFLYIVSRDLNYPLYIAYILTVSLAFTTIFGNGFDLFWPEATWWQNRAGFTFMGAQVLFTMLFVRRLLDFPRHLPRVDLVCKVVAAMCAISIPLTLTSIPVVIFSRLISLIYLISIPAFFVISVLLLKNSRPHIRLFIAGWGILFFFAMFHVLYILNLLPFSNFNVYGVMFALPVDILFFFMAVWEKQRGSDRERLRLLEEKMAALPAKSKYQKSSLTDVDIQSTLARLKILIEQEKIYLIEDLRLPDLAKALGLNRTQLSELLNSHFQKNFANFINEYRVQEARRLLIESPKQNILEIAFAIGFGSKAAFSTEFKRYTGMTAMEFREKNLAKTV